MAKIISNKKPVFIIGAARTDSIKYDTKNYRSLSRLLAEPVQQIAVGLLNRVDTVFVTHRYPTPLSLDFDREDFLRHTDLPKGEYLRFFIDDRAILGGMEVIEYVVTNLSQGPPSTVLIIGGEVFEPSVWHLLHSQRASSDSPTQDGSQESQLTQDAMERFNLQERRYLLNKYGGLPSKDKDVGLTPLSANALVADAFFRESSFSRNQMRELMCEISLHLEKYAYMNPCSYQRHKKFDDSKRKMDRITPERYERREKRERKWPFTLLDICPISNGAGALVLTNDPGGLVHKVLIAGCVINKQHANKSLLERPNIFQFDSNRLAWQELKTVLGKDCPYLRRPERGSRPILILELFDIYAFQIAMTLCEMGLYQNLKEILEDFKTNYFDPSPDIFKPENFKELSSSCGIILNPSGGSKDGHANGGFTLVKVAECFFQLTGLKRDGSLELSPGYLDFAIINNLSGAGNTAGVLALRKV